MAKVYIIGGNSAYRTLFAEYLGHEIVSSIDGAELCVFTGGEDVTPSLYGDAAHPQTYNSERRDTQEADVYEHCVYNGIKMVGICRGGQFLNVMNGGRMYQHVSKHAIHGTHLLVDVESGEPIPVSSTHHQMMMPHDEAKIVAIATLGGYREWYDGQLFKRDESNTDYEVLYYSGTKSLCFQPHPEFNGEEFEPMKKYFKQLLATYLEV